MLRLVAKGAKLRCQDGTTPCTLRVANTQYVVDGSAIANVEDHQVATNIAGFGMCRSLQNPSVAAATSAANGVLTPMPCQPPAFTPWVPGARFIYQELSGGRSVRALTNDSTCRCGFGPEVAIDDPCTDLRVEP